VSSHRDAVTATEVVRSFLACAPQLDLPTAATLLAEDVVRTGADRSVVRGRDAYLAYLARALAGTSGYRSELRRIVATTDGSVVFAELDEELTEADGTYVEVSEAMVFDLDTQGQISALTVYERGTG
jgi:limonene-1,2-epoxide hydrolase